MSEHDAWWTIHSFDLMAALRQAHSGTDPDIVYIELIANSDSERFDDDAPS